MSFILSVIMLNVVILSVVMLNVVAPVIVSPFHPSLIFVGKAVSYLRTTYLKGLHSKGRLFVLPVG
jgi:hypothetical protein